MGILKYWMLGINFCVLLISAVFSLPAESQNSPAKTSQPTCQLKVAWSPWPPFIEGEDTPKGIHIQLIDWIGKEMNCQITYIKLSWHESVTAIKTGEVDLVGRASVTEERKTFARFSQAYRESLIVLYVRRGDSTRYQANSVEDLLKQNFKIGLQRGAYYGKDVMALQAQSRYKDNFPDLLFTNGPPVHLLLDKTVDGLLESPYAIDNFLLNSQGRSQIEEYPLEIFSEFLHFMFSKKSVSDKVVNDFNNALNKVKKSENYKKHWFWKSVK